MRSSGSIPAQASGPLRSIPSRTLSVDSSSGSDTPCIEALDYSSTLRLLAVVLTDGSCALLRAAESGLLPVEQLQRPHWVCGPGSGALTIRIGGAWCWQCSKRAPHVCQVQDATVCTTCTCITVLGWVPVQEGGR